MTLDHVVADKAKVLQSFHRRAVRRNHRLKMVEPHAAVIIQAEKRGGLAADRRRGNSSSTKWLKA